MKRVAVVALLLIATPATAGDKALAAAADVVITGRVIGIGFSTDTAAKSSATMACSLRQYSMAILLVTLTVCSGSRNCSIRGRTSSAQRARDSRSMDLQCAQRMHASDDGHATCITIYRPITKADFDEISGDNDLLRAMNK